LKLVRYGISFLTRPPQVFRVKSESALHWITENNQRYLKSACSSRTFTDKKLAQKECDKYHEELVESVEDYAKKKA
jgi:hypothetical protein